MREMSVVRLGVDDGERLREIRLRALRDSPDAFASTYEREAAFSPAEWAGRLGAPGSRWWVAENGDGADVGLVCVFLEGAGAHLVSMWVAPEARGRGVGSLLADEAVAWARAAGAQRVRLWAVDGNHAARALYARKGFVPTGEVMALPSNPALTESEYALSLLGRTASHEGRRLTPE
jgi:GNAT superfamily N-acetyltransferase